MNGQTCKLGGPQARAQQGQQPLNAFEISPAGPLEDRHSTQDNEQKGTAWLRCLQA